MYSKYLYSELFNIWIKQITKCIALDVIVYDSQDSLNV